MTNQQQNQSFFTNPEDQKKLKGMVEEAEGCLVKIDAAKDLKKDIAERAKEELGLSKRLFGRLVNTFHQNNLEDQTSDLEQVETLYEYVK